ncbi:uncharacterized protein LOC144477154 [Augochlora pura]
MVKRIIKKCDEEAQKGVLVHLLNRSTARAADYTGLSQRSVNKIRMEAADSGEQLKLHYNDENKKIIRDIIYDFYVRRKIIPTCSKLLTAIRERMPFPWTKHILYEFLKSMGYEYKRSNNVKLLIENPVIVNWRKKYLHVLSYYRTRGKNIIYLDETWVDTTLSVGKWRLDVRNTIGVTNGHYTHPHIIVLLAGGRSGFVDGTELVYRSESTAGDYHGHMDAENFEKWIRKRLLPNIPPETVIVMDNAPYNRVELNKPPSVYASKKRMIAWLKENNHPDVERMNLGKHELSELVQRYKKRGKIYRIDELLRRHGHSVMRLPPCNSMCNMNPVEFAWVQWRNKMLQNKLTTELSCTELEVLVRDTIKSTSLTEWEGYCMHVHVMENEYWSKDWTLENAIEGLGLEIQSSDPEEESGDSCAENV